ncbi:SNARE associated golgi family protein [Solidesulfovibrio carbinoliphilus subsp. oakridgensis]|uniref:SNARE associated golgi family protein n=1 Tax=Solidesulfovibrio carbinoliphilus subsp. oakridgensis TaxID=694327 RepID=G7Q9Z0_9BACT|nr:VTT domain-containing protein [Solidesulfovibrio carbinoliphilus]EHJ47820.1 SNARE associated golgi family protein [Solidesulfovibrio carbinoliphilus subsp. oakridgensis]
MADMELAGDIADFLLHLDTRLAGLAAADGWRVYAVIWLVIFAETGFVVTGILPSDTVLFAASALAARGTLSVWPILVGGMLAAFGGDELNYAFGRWLGRAFGRGRTLPFVRARHLELAHRYYEEHGGLTIVAARFVPVLRSLAPLVAGVAAMPWRPFTAYNLLGKAPWTALYVAGGYFLGSIPFFATNFPAVVLLAICLPLAVAGARLAYLAWRPGGRSQ